MRSSTTLGLLGALSTAISFPAHTAALTVAELAPGDLVITEYQANPVGVADTAGEYFEVSNRRNEMVDLTGLVVRDDGSNLFTVSGLSLAPGAFGVFSNGNGTALGISVDYNYGAGMNLTNSADEIVLAGADGLELFRLAYADGDAFGAGVAAELIALPAGLESATDSDYQAASETLLLGNLGSPGTAGGTAIPAVPVPAAAWLLASALAWLGSLRQCPARTRAPVESTPALSRCSA